MTEEKKKNYEFLKDVVNNLRFSQGLYGGIYESLLELERDEQSFVEFVGSLPNFNDVLDVVFYFEQ